MKKIGIGKRGKVYDVGFCSTDLSCVVDGEQTIQYETWAGMLKRCYGSNYQEKQPSYIGCTVCEEWLDYQNFYDWYNANFYTVNGERVHLDKDILNKGNKVYSPETCRFVPESINLLLTNCVRARGEFPVGVSFYKRYNNFVARLRINNKKTHLGYFSTSDEAFNAYKIAKEAQIKVKALEYKHILPNDVYEALMKWEININD